MSIIHRLAFVAAAGLVAAATLVTGAVAGTADPPSQTISFPSRDGTTTLTGYVWRKPGGGARPAVVMMHGCGGAYSSGATAFHAGTVALQYREWGTRLAARGYVALLVDGFTPRGVEGSVCDVPYDDRPATINEVTIRPLDALGAVKALRRMSIVGQRPIALLGWSNGASAVMSTVATAGPKVWAEPVAGRTGFVGAAAFYPGCGLQGRYDAAWRPTVPTTLFVGGADETTPPSPECDARVASAQSAGVTVAMATFAGATHGFDRVDASQPLATQRANAGAKSAAAATMDGLFARWFGF